MPATTVTPVTYNNNTIINQTFGNENNVMMSTRLRTKKSNISNNDNSLKSLQMN